MKNLGEEKPNRALMWFLVAALIGFWWFVGQAIHHHHQHKEFERNSCDLEAVVCKEEIGEGMDFSNEDSGYYPALDSHEVWPDDQVR